METRKLTSFLYEMNVTERYVRVIMFLMKNNLALLLISVCRQNL